MKRAVYAIFASLTSLCWTFVLLAQPPANATPAVPRLVKFSGALTGGGGQALTGVVGVTFALYAEERGGTPLWMETQNIQADAAGHYTAILGATRNEGIPAEVFASGQGRWLGVQPQGETERPRVLLVSVPYALKAVDAETLGGLPPSAFALAGATPAAPGHISGHTAAVGEAASAQAPANAPDLTGTGTTNHFAYWSNSTTIASAALYQTAAKRVGLGTTAPTAQLEVDSPTATAIVGSAAATSGSFNGVNGQTASTAGSGVYGNATATTGSTNGVYGNSVSTSGNGVFGQNTATSGAVSGVVGLAASPGGNGVTGVNTSTGGSGVYGTGAIAGVTGAATATSGIANGVLGTAVGTSGTGVAGTSTATSGSTNGVYGLSASPGGSGVFGTNMATSGNAWGVYGQTVSPAGAAINGVNNATTGGNGVDGNATATSGAANGVYGQSSSTTGNGVFGNALSTTGGNNGVFGQTASPSGAGVTGVNNAATGGNGVNGSSNATSGPSNGVSGYSASTTGNGVSGIAAATTGGNNGMFGQTASPSGSGVTGVNNATTGGNGVSGSSNATSGASAGVSGFSSSTSGNGVSGIANASTGNTIGVQGISQSSSGTGVWGQAPGTGVVGVTELCNPTCTQTAGVAGQFSTGTGGTILNGYTGATRMFYVDSAGNGFFAGNLNVTGKVTKGSGSFKIDHPLDPANKYLSHSFVESPDMMDVYNGIARLDAKGEAWVTLPDYFEALNGDFRYQLTAIGAPAPRLYVAREVSQNRFKIAGGRPGGKVSWQVTGIRHDAYANAHRIPVTEDKPSAEQGRYLHPDVYGKGDGGELPAGLH